MGKYIFFIVILLLSCTKDKMPAINNDLVPLRIGSTWSFHRTCYDCLSGYSELDYSVTAEKIVNIDSHEWFHMKFQNLWTGSYDYFWRNDESGFYQTIYDSYNNRKSHSYYPVYNGNNKYEIISPDTGSCKRHEAYDLAYQPSLNVNGKLYDSFKYAFDTIYFDNSCTGGSFVIPSGPVMFLSKGTGIVKILEYNATYWYHLINTADSLISLKDELVSFKY